MRIRREKIKLKCYICYKILKNPVLLPCACASICQEHILNENSIIKCKKCNATFDSESISEEKFERNVKMNKKIIALQYLSLTERKSNISLTQQLDEMKQIHETINAKILEYPIIQYEHFFKVTLNQSFIR